MAIIGRLLHIILYKTRLYNIKNSSLTFLIISGLFLQRSALGQISVFPSDTEARIRQTVIMYCRIIQAVGKNIEWHHTPYGLHKLNAVYLDGFIYANYRERFSVIGDAEKGERNLRILNVTLEDAGKYMCMHKTDSHSAELIVFATFPSNQSCAAIVPKNGFIGNNVCRLEPDIINVSCNFSYCGNIVPAVQWKNASGSILPSVLTSRAEVNTSTLIIYKALKDDTFTCYIRYLLSDIQSKFSWTVDINVHNISHNETVQNIGCDSEPINCTNTRFPYNCVTMWMSQNGSTFPNTVLYTTDLPSGLYKCNAQCDIRGTKCSILQQTVNLNCAQGSSGTEPQSNATKSGANTALVASVVTVLFIITSTVTVVAIFIWKRRVRLTSKSGDGEAYKGERKDEITPALQESQDDQQHDDSASQTVHEVETLLVDSQYKSDLRADVHSDAQDNANSS